MTTTKINFRQIHTYGWWVGGIFSGGRPNPFSNFVLMF
jgi:hypothetical protein